MSPPNGWVLVFERPIAFPDADEAIELRAVFRLVEVPDPGLVDVLSRDGRVFRFVLSIEVRNPDGSTVGSQLVGDGYSTREEAIAAADRVIVVPILLPVGAP